MTPHSELGEDVWINSHLQDFLPQTGIYLDLGCAHPIHSSQTAWLRERGWKGLAVDGNPNWGREWPAGVFRCAVVSNEDLVKFEVRDDAGHSRIVKSGGDFYDAMTADQLLYEAGFRRLDFLSLDLEGHEYEALLSLNLNVFHPKIIVSEHSTAGIGVDTRVRTYLASHWNYTVEFETSSNTIYLRR